MIAQIATIGQIQTRKFLPKIKIQYKPPETAKPPVPYFERNGFLQEEVSRQELSSMYDLGFVKMTAQDLLETKTAINVIGYNPATKLINVLIESDVLCFSRPGVDHHPHLKFLTTLLPRLRKEAHASHLALALPKCLQRLLDVFVVTGELLPNLSPINLADYGLNSQNDFLELLKAARLAGYQLVAIEPDSPMKAFDPWREQAMAANIQAILKKQERAKVILLAPDRHLGYTSVGEWMPIAGVLKEQGIAVCTVNQYWQRDFMPKVLTCLLRTLARPVALASKDIKLFAALQSRSFPLEHILPSNWDMTIIYPKISAGRLTILKRTLDSLKKFFQ